MEAVKPARSRIKRLTFVDVRSTFLKLFLDSEVAARAATRCGIELPEHWEAICKDTIDRLLVKKMAYEDATPFLYVVERIRGSRPIRP